VEGSELGLVVEAEVTVVVVAGSAARGLATAVAQGGSSD
jgi:hypothetical protein